MVELIGSLQASTVRTNLERVQAQIASVGRRASQVQVLAAVKYLLPEALEALAQAGVELVGENRAQALVAKQDAHPGRFTWDFIGQLQSRRVSSLLGRVRLIHSLASESALEQLRRHEPGATRVLVEVNVAQEPGKAGVTPAALGDFIARCPVEVAGLMTMPPRTDDPERSRAHFAALRELGEQHGLPELSMGTSQDYLVAVQEGATIIRLGQTLYRPSATALKPTA